MYIESWNGRLVFIGCGVAMIGGGAYGVLFPTKVPLNIVDPAASPALDVVNQVCTVLICLAFVGAGMLMAWTGCDSIRRGRRMVDDTPRDPLTLRGLALRILLVFGILVTMLAGSLLLDHAIQSGRDAADLAPRAPRLP